MGATWCLRSQLDSELAVRNLSYGLAADGERLLMDDLTQATQCAFERGGVRGTTSTTAAHEKPELSFCTARA